MGSKAPLRWVVVLGKRGVRSERRVTAVCQVSGRRSLPNLGLLDPERVLGLVLELNHFHSLTFRNLYLYLKIDLNIYHLVQLSSGLNLSHIQGQS